MSGKREPVSYDGGHFDDYLWPYPLHQYVSNLFLCIIGMPILLAYSLVRLLLDGFVWSTAQYSLVYLKLCCLL